MALSELFPVDYIIEHDSKEPFDGIYLFIDCDYRLPYTNPAPTDGLTLMSYLQWASTSRLANFELQKLENILGNNIIIIKPDTNILTNAFDINPDRMKATFEAGVVKGKKFLQQTK